MAQPLVLAIEPDLRQAAIVKRIVREKVLADVAVVDSRDAALEAMQTAVPDVLLLSALLSPRDEDELVAHLRTRRDAEHLQTHTIPQLASSIGGDDERPRGLLSAFRRRKGSSSAPAGCDPDLFAEEIRTYLKRASERKREARSTGPAFDGVAPTAAARASAMAAESSPAAEAPVASSWASPFEWRPSRSTTPAPPPAPEPAFVAAAAATAVEEPPAFEAHAFEPAIIESPVLESPVLESRVFESSIVEPPAVDAPMFESPVYEPEVAEPVIVAAIVPRPAVRYPLTMRTMKGWWFVEGKEDPSSREPVSELRSILSHLSVPLMIASVTYADGCHVRRVRLAGA